MTLATKRLKLQIKLANKTGTNQPNSFAESGTDSVDITNLRTSVRIANAGSVANQTADVAVHGLTPSLMNQLSTLGMVFNIVPLNEITISAGEDGAGYATVFSGTIWNAYGDYSAQPDVSFRFSCLAAGAQNVINAQPTSTTTPTNVADTMSGFARQMNMTFENNGVSVTLPPSYFSGSVMTQAKKAAEAANIELTIVGGNKLVIFPKGGNRATPNVPVISARTGMIGYPAFTQQGVIVRTLFNPQITFGSLIRIESSVLTGIAGAQPGSNFPSQWAVSKLDLSLDSFTPGGRWESMIFAYNPGYSKPVLPPK